MVFVVLVATHGVESDDPKSPFGSHQTKGAQKLSSLLQLISISFTVGTVVMVVFLIPLLHQIVRMICQRQSCSVFMSFCLIAVALSHQQLDRPDVCVDT